MTLNDSEREHAEYYAKYFQDAEIDYSDQAFKDVKWEEGVFAFNEKEFAFIGNEELPSDVLMLQTPFQFWSYLVSDEIIDHLTNQTNIYAAECNQNEKIITNDEVKRFIGISHFMSVYEYPSSRSYWSKFGFSPIMNAMARNRYEYIRSNLHMNDNSLLQEKSSPTYDKLFKVRPLINLFNKQFAKIPMREHLSLDENVNASKSANFLRQYLPNKPHKWGTKLFCICDDMGYCYQFEVGAK